MDLEERLVLDKRRAAQSGYVGVLALLAGLFGTLLWAGMIASPVRLVTGLLDARRGVQAAEKALSKGAIKDARAATLSAAAAADRAVLAYELPSPFVELARLVPAVDRAWQETGHIVTATELSAEAALGSLDVAQNALRGPRAIITKDPEDPEGSIVQIDRVEAAGDTIARILDSIRGVREELAAVNARNLPGRFRSDLAEALDRANETETLLEDAAAGFEILPGLLGGDGPRSYLFGFQNPAEERGSGGAMLQFAVLTLDDGRPSGLSEDETETVYTVDVGRRPVQIDLPEDAWYVAGIQDAQRFGNANWSPDWPLSAQLTLDYARATVERCEAEQSDTEKDCPLLPDIDGVFAVDPLATQKLLPGTGPFQAGSGNYISERSIVHLALYKLYGSYPIPSIRRDVLAKIVDGFYRRLLDPAHPAELVQGMGNSLAEKHMQLWMLDPAEQAFIERMNWDGAIEQDVEGDYFYVVEQNVGGNKLDYFDAHETKLDVSFDGDDALVEANIKVENLVFLPQPRWMMGDSGPMHRPMLNLYTLPDAQLLDFEVKGTRLASPSIELAGLPGGPPAEHRELDKKVWSATLEIDPHDSGVLRYTYRVPGVLLQNGDRTIYRLTLQHQPRVHASNFALKLRLPRGAAQVRATGFSRSGRVLTFERALRQDRVLEVSWQS